MASYSISFKSSVSKDLRSIPKAAVNRILDKIELLSEQPLPKGVSKITRAELLYRIRVGDYRVIYGIPNNGCCGTERRFADSFATIHTFSMRGKSYYGLEILASRCFHGSRKLVAHKAGINYHPIINNYFFV